MRKVVLFNLITLDGFFEGPNHAINWHNVDEEFNEFAIEQTGSSDGLIFGRVTYEMMASYWHTQQAINDDPIVAGQMNAIQKFVFSKTLQKADWNNTRLVKEDAAGEISKLKQQPGRDLFIFGSANLAASLTNLGLIDEYRLIVNPIILGNGNSLFKGVTFPLNLKLLKTKTFRNGNVLLYYQPDKP